MAKEQKASKTSPESSYAEGAAPKPEKRKFLGFDRDLFKIVLGILVLIGIVTFTIQNLQDVPITFIQTWQIPGVVLYSGIFVAGMLLGWIVKSLSLRRKNSKS